MVPPTGASAAPSKMQDSAAARSIGRKRRRDKKKNAGRDAVGYTFPSQLQPEIRKVSGILFSRIGNVTASCVFLRTDCMSFLGTDASFVPQSRTR